MNALELIQQVRAHGADLVVEKDRLVVRGIGEPLPDELRAALSQHRAELLVALGVPFDRTVAGILQDLRPHLPPALRRLPDDRLLALVNWSIFFALNALTHCPASADRRRCTS